MNETESMVLDLERQALAKSIATELAETMAVPKLMTASRAAAYLGISDKSFRGIVASGAVPGVTVPGLKQLRYTPGMLDAYVASLQPSSSLVDDQAS